MSNPVTHTTDTYGLQRRIPKEGSLKVQFSIMRVAGKKFVGTAREAPVWRRTMARLEWFPRLKTWRLVDTQRSVSRHVLSRGAWDAGWKQVVLADMGDIPEADACEIAISTLSLLGY